MTAFSWSTVKGSLIFNSECILICTIRRVFGLIVCPYAHCKQQHVFSFDNYHNLDAKKQNLFGIFHLYDLSHFVKSQERDTRSIVSFSSMFQIVLMDSFK